MPNDSFYNTGIATYIWIITKDKPEEHIGKVQLIDASKCYESRRKSIGNKRVDITDACRELIVKAYGAYTDHTYKQDLESGAHIVCKSRVLDSVSLGYNKIVVETPEMDENGQPVMKKWWDVTDEDIQKMTDATVWCEAGFDNFRGGGFSSHFVTRAEMPATMIRLNLVKGLGPVLQIAEGWTVHLPDEVTDTLMERTNPTWPCTWFTPRCDGKAGSPFASAYDVMAHWGANHGAISYGHIGADLITLCSILRIPVSMHNVPQEQIFRPAAWDAFGMDREGQDYRACAAYGPMYRNMQ